MFKNVSKKSSTPFTLVKTSQVKPGFSFKRQVSEVSFKVFSAMTSISITGMVFAPWAFKAVSNRLVKEAVPVIPIVSPVKGFVSVFIA